MRLLTSTVPSNCDIVLHGDNHEGNPATYRTGLRKLVKWIGAKPNRFFVHMGDEIEATMTDHKYYQHDPDAEDIPLRQMEAVKGIYAPVSSRCLAWIYGNHPDRLRRFGNLTEKLCKELGMPYGSKMCKLKLDTRAGAQIVKMFLWHGPRRCGLNSQAKDLVQREANQKASLKRLLERKASDCLIMGIGHVHKLIVLEPTQELLLYDDGRALRQTYLKAGDGAARYIEPNRRFYFAAGSFLRSYMVGKDTYAEDYGYDPVELGYLLVRIRKSKVVEIVKKVM